MAFCLPFGVSYSQEATLVPPPAVEDPPPAPVRNVVVKDTPDDEGNSISISWDLSPDDAGRAKDVVSYDVLRSESAQGPFERVKTVPRGNGRAEDVENVKNNTPYFYVISVKDSASNVVSSGVVGPVEARAQLLNLGRFNTLIATITYFALLLFFIYSAKKGKSLFIRRIPGLDAVEEAVGRATEMGKPILYVSGLSTMSDVATIAAVNILSGVARTAAEYDTRLIVPCCDPVVMTVEQEVVKEAYMSVGKPDAYREDDVFFLTRSQFAYVAAVDGIMVRDKPATNLYMGMFFAESLILAETGAATGAIQIAGTDAVAQLPFFIAACDYTLIGEELYAASAYLSRAPLLLGSLKGQDWMKAIVVIGIVAGVIALLFGSDIVNRLFASPFLMFRG